MTPRIVTPSSMAVFALMIMTTCMPKPWALSLRELKEVSLLESLIPTTWKLTPSRVLAVGRDIPFGSRPIENSVWVAHGAHVREFIRALFAEVIKPTSNHDLCLAGQNSVARYFKRQWMSETRLKVWGSLLPCSNGNLDGARGRHKEKIDLTSNRVDEAK